MLSPHEQSFKFTDAKLAQIWISLLFSRVPGDILGSPDLPSRRGLAIQEESQARHIAIVGTGVIGASWTTGFLAGGFDVVATGP